MEITLPTSSKPETVWDRVVPIIKNPHGFEAYLSDGIDEPAYYNELCYNLRNAHSHENVHIYINTPGGIIDSAFMIIDAIKASKAKVIGHLAGTVASAGTMLALACDELIVADHTAFMIHNYSGGNYGKGHEMKARQEFIDSALEETFYTFYKGFLSDKEMKEVIDGKDMWMGKPEIIERWGKRQELLSNAVERISDKAE